MAEYTADELAKGVNLAAAALKDGPVADQVQGGQGGGRGEEPATTTTASSAAWSWPAAVPDWLDIKLTPQEIEEKRKAAFEERMAKMPELDAAVRKALEMKPHTVEVVPAK